MACALALSAALVLALAWSLQPLVHDDLFWHLRTGEWIAAHHRVPLVDLFSYTRPGARWITHEWGFSLLSFLVFRAAGAGGLVLLTSALALGIFAAVAWRALDLAAGEEGGAAADRGQGAFRPGTVPSPPLPSSRCLLLAALVAVGMWAASPEIFLRAALAGELMLALALAALTRYRRTGRRRWLVGVAGLFWVWANLHSGVVFGLGVLVLYALEPFVAAPSEESRLPGSRSAGRRSASAAARRVAAPYLWTLAAAAGLSLLNPNGIEAPLYPFRLARLLFASGIPWELGHFAATGPGGNGAGAALWLLVAVLLLGLLPWRQARRVSPAEGASIAIFLLATLASRRFAFDLVVIALPTLYKLLALPVPEDALGTGAAEPGGAAQLIEVAAPPTAPTAPAGGLRSSAGGISSSAGELPSSAGGLRSSSGGLRGLAGRPALSAALLVLFLLPVAPAAVAGAAAAWARRPAFAGAAGVAGAGGGLLAESLPQAAAGFVAAQGIDGPGDRMFNHQNYGGFLGWRLRVPVFWDGRNDVFAELVREVATQPFGVTAGRYGVGYLVLAEHDYPGIEPEIAAGRWGLVYWDDFCAVYLRRGPRYAALLRRLELRLLPPFGGRPGLAALAADPRGAAAARAELAQVLAANPANQRALYFSGMISLYRGDLSRGIAELLAARRIRPSEQVDRVLERLRRLAAPPARPPVGPS